MSNVPDPTDSEVPHPKVASMAIIGHMTPKTCKIWVRLYREGAWWLVVSEKPLEGNLDSLDGMQVDAFLKLKNITALTYQTNITKATDNTHTFLVRGLISGKRYYYAVIADLAELQRIPRRTEIGYFDRPFFNTLPEDLSRITFGFFSCHDPFSTATRSEGAWPLYYDALVERGAQFSIGGGDQVYVDTNNKEDMYDMWEWLAKYKKEIIERFTSNNVLQETQLIEYFAGIYRSYYRIYWNFLNLRKTFARFPQYMIWDDHEIMDGWGSYTNDERKKLLNKLLQNDNEAENDRIIKLMFEAAKVVYLEYQHRHNPNPRVNVVATDDNSDLVWDYSFFMGKYAFYVLDMRGHHDYERRKQKNALLGGKQMQRLKDWLASPSVNRADAAVIVSPVPVVHWAGYVDKFDIGPLKDDLRDEWEHRDNHPERNTLLDAILSYSDGSNVRKNSVPVVILSGDVHCASVFALEDYDRYPNAKVFNVTSSSISRKPAPVIAESFIKSTGKIDGYPQNRGRATRYYTLTGQYNFVLLEFEKKDGKVSLVADLYWPGGKEREAVKKRVQLV